MFPDPDEAPLTRMKYIFASNAFVTIAGTVQKYSNPAPRSLIWYVLFMASWQIGDSPVIVVNTGRGFTVTE